LTWDDCRLLVESVVDYAIFMLGVDGRVATWNHGAEKIKGYSASEIVGEHFSKFFSTEDVALGKPEQELRTASENGRAEEEAVSVKGVVRWNAQCIMHPSRRSGFKRTAVMGDQLRVGPVQRRGVRARARA
jgi:PAS domain S-box-containing protein